MTGRLLPVQENESRMPLDYSILDEGDAYSLINVVPPNLQALLLNLPAEYLTYSEHDLREIVNPDPALNSLRLQFWREYSDSVSNARAFDIRSVFSGVCTREYFQHLLLRQETFAWIILPPRNYVAMQEELLVEGLHRLRSFLSQPFVDKKEVTKISASGDVTETKETKMNIPAVAEARKIVEMLENRLRGSVVQKLAIQNQTVVSALPSQSQDPMSVIQQAINIIEAQEAIPEALDIPLEAPVAEAN